MERLEERYRNDAPFRTMVDSLRATILDLHLSPTEVREAALYASYLVELEHPRPIILPSSVTAPMRPANCDACGHRHAGPSLAYICIGCPCPERPQ